MVASRRVRGTIRGLLAWASSECRTLVRHSEGHLKRVRVRVLKTSPHPHGGYLLVNLHRDGRQQSGVKVHCLVLEAFDGPCPPGLEACHRDDDYANNNVENLRWDTHSANQHDQVRNGRHANASKTYCKHGHEFTPENTYIYPVSGKRTCRECTRRLQRQYYWQRKGATV